MKFTTPTNIYSYLWGLFRISLTVSMFFIYGWKAGLACILLSIEVK